MDLNYARQEDTSTSNDARSQRQPPGQRIQAHRQQYCDRMRHASTPATSGGCFSNVPAGYGVSQLSQRYYPAASPCQVAQSASGPFESQNANVSTRFRPVQPAYNGMNQRALQFIPPKPYSGLQQQDAHQIHQLQEHIDLQQLAGLRQSHHQSGEDWDHEVLTGIQQELDAGEYLSHVQNGRCIDPGQIQQFGSPTQDNPNSQPAPTAPMYGPQAQAPPALTTAFDHEQLQTPDGSPEPSTIQATSRGQLKRKCEKCKRFTNPASEFGGRFCSRHIESYRREIAPPVDFSFEEGWTFATARARIYPHRPARNPPEGRPAPADVDKLVERLIDAVNTEYVEDGDNYSWHYLDQQHTLNAKFYDVREVNARMRLLAQAIIVHHWGGPMPYAEGGDNGGYGRPEDLGYEQRVDLIIEVMEKNKRICMDVIEGRGVIALAEHPAGYQLRKMSNIKGNFEKARLAGMRGENPQPRGRRRFAAPKFERDQDGELQVNDGDVAEEPGAMDVPALQILKPKRAPRKAKRTVEPARRLDRLVGLDDPPPRKRAKTVRDDVQYPVPLLQDRGNFQHSMAPSDGSGMANPEQYFSPGQHGQSPSVRPSMHHLTAQTQYPAAGTLPAGSMVGLTANEPYQTSRAIVAATNNHAFDVDFQGFDQSMELLHRQLSLNLPPARELWNDQSFASGDMHPASSPAQMQQRGFAGEHFSGDRVDAPTIAAQMQQASLTPAAGDYETASGEQSAANEMSFNDCIDPALTTQPADIPTGVDEQATVQDSGYRAPSTQAPVAQMINSTLPQFTNNETLDTSGGASGNDHPSIEHEGLDQYFDFNEFDLDATRAGMDPAMLFGNGNAKIDAQQMQLPQHSAAGDQDLEFGHPETTALDVGCIFPENVPTGTEKKQEDGQDGKQQGGK